MKHIIFLAVFIITTLVSSAQTRIDTIFSNLDKGGAILVRLRTNEHSINALKGKDDALMERIIRERDKQNQEVMDAFNSSFTYCPVYYFYSSDSKRIINHEFSEVLFDYNLNPIPDTLELSNNYIVAQFGYTQKDTTKYLIGTEYRYREYIIDGEKKGRRELVEVYGSPSAFNVGVDALVFYTPELQPLIRVKDLRNKELVRIGVQEPGREHIEDEELIISENFFYGNVFVQRYPNNVRTFEGFPFIERSKEKTVMRMQSKLEDIGRKYIRNYNPYMTNPNNDFIHNRTHFPN